MDSKYWLLCIALLAALYVFAKIIIFIDKITEGRKKRHYWEKQDKAKLRQLEKTKKRLERKLKRCGYLESREAILLDGVKTMLITTKGEAPDEGEQTF